MELFYKLMGIAGAMAETGVADGAAEGMTGTGEVGMFEMILGTILQLSPIIIMFVVMYFLMIRPEKKRKKKEQEMLNALKHGDRVCTIGGIYGTITNIKDDTITLVVGRENMTMVVARWAIRSVEDVSIENDSEALN